VIQPETAHTATRRRFAGAQGVLGVALLAASSLLVHGYHLGQEDGAIYLPDIKNNLDPALFPYDSAFFLAQTRWMLFDRLVAASARLTRAPLDYTVFLWHLFTVFLVLLACRELARRCFSHPTAQWAAVLTVWAALLLPVAGTQLDLTERYLHPRDLATAAVLFAFVAVLDRRLTALVWLAFAAVVHPTMAFFGAFHLLFQSPGAGKLARFAVAGFLVLSLLGLAALPGLGAAPNEAWREVLASRPYLFPLRWHWYEWLGVIAPLLLLRWFALLAQRGTKPPAGAGSISPAVERICRRAVVAALVATAVAIVISIVPQLESLVTIEPMRALHFVYVLLVFFAGGLLGEHILLRRPLRWLLFLAPVCMAFFLTNWLTCRSSPLVEWPGRIPRNAWVDAFDWIRRNTPRDALCALDPRYLLRPGEDAHGFRGFAERSMLAEWVKDRSVAALEPGLAYQWRQEVRDRENWQSFGGEDFRRLRRRYGVTWVVVERSAQTGLSCPYANDAVMVCRVE